MARYKVILDNTKQVITIDAECVTASTNVFEFTKGDGSLFKKSWIRAGNVVAIIHEDMEA